MGCRVSQAFSSNRGGEYGPEVPILADMDWLSWLASGGAGVIAWIVAIGSIRCPHYKARKSTPSLLPELIGISLRQLLHVAGHIERGSRP